MDLTDYARLDINMNEPFMRWAKEEDFIFYFFDGGRFEYSMKDFSFFV